jgi:hypothetical protein
MWLYFLLFCWRIVCSSHSYRAQCVLTFRFSPRQFTVRLGDVDLKRDDEPSSPQTYQVVEVRAHPRFSRVGFYNDIALLVMERTARRSRYVIPLCLPPPRYRHEAFVGRKPTVVGWGTTYYGEMPQCLDSKNWKLALSLHINDCYLMLSSLTEF